MKLENLFLKAQKGGFWLWMLNRALQYTIPFNKPHGIVVTRITDDGIETQIPYKRKNLNHIKGIHACGLATVAEFTSGLVLLSKLGATEYRLIMESIEVKYHYQAKSAATARFEIDDNRLQNEITGPLKTEDAVYIRCEIPVHDKANNLLCTAYTNWQVKSWKKVKTKL
jgi:acyl-coenzyme A thioesterase PaaI-like protein